MQLQNEVAILQFSNFVTPDVFYFRHLLSAGTSVHSVSAGLKTLAELNNNNNNHLEALEVCRLERRAYKTMATEKGLYNATSTVHYGYYPKQITRILF